MPDLRPQAGPQMQFFQSSADIVLYGGAAGGGKTWSLLVEPLRHVFSKEGFNCTIFRRTIQNLKKQGSIMDASKKIYRDLKGKFNKTDRIWYFPPYWNSIGFGSCQYDEDVLGYKGAEVCALFFDELTEFSEYIFTYLLSRNRSTSGVRPYVRATTNPDANSWVKKWIEPWISSDYPVRAAFGELLYFRRFSPENPVPEDVAPYVLHRDGSMVWVTSDCPRAKSMTYIPASIFDNQALLDQDPNYISNLEALSYVERQRLLYGDWHATEGGGKMMSRDDFKIVERMPYMSSFVRAWDLAGTESPEEQRRRKRKNNDPDWTVGVLMGRTGHDKYYVMDVVRFRGNEAEIEKRIKQVAESDNTTFGMQVVQYIEQEQGASGKNYIKSLKRRLKGVRIVGKQVSGSKQVRAKPWSVEARNGNVFVMSDSSKRHNERWNDVYRNEMHYFPMQGVHDDCVDATTLGYMFLKRGLFEEYNAPKMPERTEVRGGKKYSKWRKQL